MKDNVKLIAGGTNQVLAKDIANILDIPLTSTTRRKFSDGELFVQINENVRRSDSFIIQSTCQPVNDNLQELLLWIDTLKRASADRITAVIPYFGYARQDRKNKPRVPISASLVAKQIQVAGAHRVMVVDLHSGQIQGFFDIPVDNLYMSPIIADYIRSHYIIEDEIVVVSPDTGGVARARTFASKLSDGVIPLAFLNKYRPHPNECTILSMVGNVEGKHAIIIDDIIDTAGTITEAGKIILEKGAKEVTIVATHAVLSGPALKRIKETDAIGENGIILSNTIPVTSNKKIKIINVAPLIAEAIKRTHMGESISCLFDS